MMKTALCLSQLRDPCFPRITSTKWISSARSAGNDRNAESCVQVQLQGFFGENLIDHVVFVIRYARTRSRPSGYIWVLPSSRIHIHINLQLDAEACENPIENFPIEVFRVIFIYGHTKQDALHPVRSAKLSCLGPR